MRLVTIFLYGNCTKGTVVIVANQPLKLRDHGQNVGSLFIPRYWVKNRWHVTVGGSEWSRLFCYLGGRMNIVEIPVNDLHPYEKNAKKHPEDQVQHIANSLQKFGWKQPIVIDKDNVVVVGHGRLLAAKKLGMEKVPCVVADDLTEDEIKAFRLIDNKTNESEWNDELLELELEELSELDDIDMSDFGFELSDGGGASA